MRFLRLAILIILVGTANLLLRYGYGPRARRSLAVLAASSVALAVGLSLAFGGDREPGVAVLLGLGWSVPLFLAAANLWAEGTRRRKHAHVLDRIRVLERRRADLEGELARLERQAEADGARLRTLELAAQGARRQLEQVRRQLEAWVQAGESPRVRATRLQEWERDLAVCSREELEALRRRPDNGAAGERSAEGQADREAHRAAVEAEALRRLAQPAEGALDALRRQRDATRAGTEAARSELGTVLEELKGWRRLGAGLFWRKLELD